MMLQPPPRPDLPDAPGASDAAGLARPSVTWSVWEALLAYALVGVVLAQAIVAGVLVVAFGIDISAAAADGPAVALTIVIDLVTLAGLAGWLQWRHPGWVAALQALEPAADLSSPVQ